MTIKKILLKQFTACYDENGRFVALKNAVKDLTAEQANWKTENLDKRHVVTKEGIPRGWIVHTSLQFIFWQHL